MSKPADLVQSTLDLRILRMLALEPMHCWTIAQRIRSEWAASKNNRRAKYDTLTESGRKALDREVAQWERLSGAISMIVRTA